MDKKTKIEKAIFFSLIILMFVGPFITLFLLVILSEMQISAQTKLSVSFIPVALSFLLNFLFRFYLKMDWKRRTFRSEIEATEALRYVDDGGLGAIPYYIKYKKNIWVPQNTVLKSETYFDDTVEKKEIESFYQKPFAEKKFLYECYKRFKKVFFWTLLCMNVLLCIIAVPAVFCGLGSFIFTFFLGFKTNPFDSLLGMFNKIPMFLWLIFFICVVVLKFWLLFDMAKRDCLNAKVRDEMLNNPLKYYFKYMKKDLD